MVAYGAWMAGRGHGRLGAAPSVIVVKVMLGIPQHFDDMAEVVIRQRVLEVEAGFGFDHQEEAVLGLVVPGQRNLRTCILRENQLLRLVERFASAIPGLGGQETKGLVK